MNSDEFDRTRTALRGLSELDVLLAGLLAHAPLALQILDAEGHPVVASPAFEALAGGALAKEGEVEGVSGLLARIRAGELAFPLLIGLERSGGRAILRTETSEARQGALRGRLVPLHGPAGGLAYVLLDFSEARDLAEGRRLEEQALRAEKMEAVGRLAGGVAHDFNNMLSAILGFAGLVVAELQPGDPLRADVEEIQKAAERAAALTRQLLAFSGKQILEPRVLDVGRFVRELEAMLRRVIGGGVELRLCLAARLGPAMVDPAQLEQVLLSLVFHARDALPEGGTITIEADDVSLDGEYAKEHMGVVPGEYVMLAISDDGAGTPEDVRDRIFEPFFSTRGPGTRAGLGLATVFGIVKQSGGHVGVDSEPGQGTTFKVYLPRASDAPASAPGAASLPTGLSAQGTILLVEDEPAVRHFARRALRREGYVVLEAANGGEALLIAEQHEGPIHVLLTDVVMPRMNGRQLAERLQKIRPSMKVVYMSGFTEHAIAHRGVLEAGIRFVPKPLSLEVLLRRMREAFEEA